MALKRLFVCHTWYWSPMPAPYWAPDSFVGIMSASRVIWENKRYRVYCTGAFDLGVKFYEWSTRKKLKVLSQVFFNWPYVEWQTKVLHHYSTAYHSQKGRPSSRDKPLQTSPRRIPCLCTSKFVPPVVSSLSLSNLVCGALQPDNGKQDLPQVGTPNLLTPRERPALTKRGMSMCFPHQGGTWEPPNNHSFPGLCVILEMIQDNRPSLKSCIILI